MLALAGVALGCSLLVFGGWQGGGQGGVLVVWGWGEALMGG